MPNSTHMKNLKRNFHFSAFAALASFITTFPTLGAAVIFSTDFVNASQDSTNGPISMGGTVATGFTVSSIAKSATATFSIWEYDTSSGGGWDSAPLFAGARPAQLPNALDVNQSVEFTITNNSSSLVSINLIQFNLVRKGFSDLAGTTVWSSLDSYSIPIVSFSNNDVSGTKSLVSTGTLTGDNMLDLLVGESMTLRIALWTESGSASNARLGIDDIQISVIPEPRLAALSMGLLVAGFIIWRRRRS